MSKSQNSPDVLLPLTLAVAEKANVDVEVVERIFEQIGVTEEVGTRHPENLTLKRLMFKGEKKAAQMGNGPFAFEWPDLEAGLWLVLSDGVNQIGKSTIIEVMMWALRGRVRQLRPEVRSWVERVELDFSVGADAYRVQFDDDGNVPVGTLQRFTSGPMQVIATFKSDAQFERVMDDLMMRRFTLPAIPYINRKAETPELFHHKWVLYADSMFIEGSHSAILGDVAIAGLWWRMLTLFIGMPHYAAYLLLKTANELADATRGERKKGDGHDVSTAGEVAQLKARIEELTAQVNASNAEMPMSGDVQKAFSAFTSQAIACSNLEKELEEIRHQHSVATSHLNESRAALRRLEEGAAAKRFFSGLKPVCCPRCAEPFAAQRLENEQAEGSCAVCDRTSASDDDGAVDAAIEEAKEQVDAASLAKSEVASREAKKAYSLRTAKKEMDVLAEDLRLLESRASDHGALQQIRFELERARGAYEQLLKHAPKQGPIEGDGDVEERRRILGIAVKIADERAKGGIALLEEFQKELVQVAVRVGFRGLERISLRGNAIKLWVSGVDGNFGKQTPGQRLRLRISLIIAMMKFARQSGKGNHPGVLFIDSPGAEELSPSDLTAMMNEISSLCDETDNLQVFVSSARGDTCKGATDPKRQRWGTATKPMF